MLWPATLALFFHIRLGTNDGYHGFNGADFQRRMAALVGTFPRVPMNRVLLISPPPLWRDGAYEFSAEIINHQIPFNLRELAGDMGCRFVDVYQAMIDAKLPASISCDGCHVDQGGQAFIRDVVLAEVAQVLRFASPPPAGAERRHTRTGRRRGSAARPLWRPKMSLWSAVCTAPA